MSPSSGKPTATPWALSWVVGQCARSSSRVSVRASAKPSPSLYFPIPTPSIIARTTGPRRGVNDSFFFNGSTIVTPLLKIFTCAIARLSRSFLRCFSEDFFGKDRISHAVPCFLQAQRVCAHHTHFLL